MTPATPALYFRTAVILFALLALTVLLAHVSLGAAGPVLALTIAVAKAVLVGLFFMHLRWEHGISRLFAGAGVAWLLILMGLTLSDFMSRGWLAAR